MKSLSWGGQPRWPSHFSVHLHISSSEKKIGILMPCATRLLWHLWLANHLEYPWALETLHMVSGMWDPSQHVDEKRWTYSVYVRFRSIKNPRGKVAIQMNHSHCQTSRKEAQWMWMRVICPSEWTDEAKRGDDGKKQGFKFKNRGMWQLRVHSEPANVRGEVQAREMDTND